MTLYGDAPYGAQQPPLVRPMDDVSLLGPHLLFNFGEGNMHTLENYRPLMAMSALGVFMAALLLYKIPTL